MAKFEGLTFLYRAFWLGPWPVRNLASTRLQTAEGSGVGASSRSILGRLRRRKHQGLTFHESLVLSHPGIGAHSYLLKFAVCRNLVPPWLIVIQGVGLLTVGYWVTRDGGIRAEELLIRKGFQSASP